MGFGRKLPKGASVKAATGKPSKNYLGAITRGNMQYSDAICAELVNTVRLIYPELPAKLDSKLEPLELVTFDVKQWRYDVIFPTVKLCIEVQGGVFTHGKHSRGENQVNDMYKSNSAQRVGYACFQFPPRDLSSGKAATDVIDYIASYKAGLI